MSIRRAARSPTLPKMCWENPRSRKCSRNRRRFCRRDRASRAARGHAPERWNGFRAGGDALGVVIRVKRADHVETSSGQAWARSSKRSGRFCSQTRAIQRMRAPGPGAGVFFGPGGSGQGMGMTADSRPNFRGGGVLRLGLNNNPVGQFQAATVKHALQRSFQDGEVALAIGIARGGEDKFFAVGFAPEGDFAVSASQQLW